MATVEFKSEQFSYLCDLVFTVALGDVNSVRSADEVLVEPDDVSLQSFKRYLADHHVNIARHSSLEALVMQLYKKAIDDIAFQANIYGFLLREIPIRQQRDSCDIALENFNNPNQDMKTHLAW